MNTVSDLLPSTWSPISLPVDWKKASSPTHTSSPTVEFTIVQAPPSGTTRSPLIVWPVSVPLQDVLFADADGDSTSRASAAAPTKTNNFLMAPPSVRFFPCAFDFPAGGFERRSKGTGPTAETYRD